MLLGTRDRPGRGLECVVVVQRLVSSSILNTLRD